MCRRTQRYEGKRSGDSLVTAALWHQRLLPCTAIRTRAPSAPLRRRFEVFKSQLPNFPRSAAAGHVWIDKKQVYLGKDRKMTIVATQTSVWPACHPRPAAPSAAGAFDDPKQAACGHDIMALRSKGQVSRRGPTHAMTPPPRLHGLGDHPTSLTSPVQAPCLHQAWAGCPAHPGRPPVLRTSTSRCPCTSN